MNTQVQNKRKDMENEDLEEEEDFEFGSALEDPRTIVSVPWISQIASSNMGHSLTFNTISPNAKIPSIQNIHKNNEHTETSKFQILSILNQLEQTMQ